MKLPFKLFFSDIDGTLLDASRNVSSETISAIGKIKNSTPVILISSRQPSAMHYLQRDLGVLKDPIICYNGGLIMNQDKILSSTTISNSIVCAALKKAMQIQLHLSIYHEDSWFAPRKDHWSDREENNTRVKPQITSFENMQKVFEKEAWGAHKMMGMGDPELIDELIQFLETAYPNQVHCYRSKDTYVEISPRSISKKTAIEHLIEKVYPNLDIKDCIAFGDNYNDIEMLEAVGIGVAVENAKEEVKSIAKYHTKTNKNHGVAHFLESLHKNENT